MYVCIQISFYLLENTSSFGHLNTFSEPRSLSVLYKFGCISLQSGHTHIYIYIYVQNVAVTSHQSPVTSHQSQSPVTSHQSVNSYQSQSPATSYQSQVSHQPPITVTSHSPSHQSPVTAHSPALTAGLHI